MTGGEENEEESASGKIRSRFSRTIFFSFAGGEFPPVLADPEDSALLLDAGSLEAVKGVASPSPSPASPDDEELLSAPLAGPFSFFWSPDEGGNVVRGVATNLVV
jgi:hypothetical protein